MFQHYNSHIQLHHLKVELFQLNMTGTLNFHMSRYNDLTDIVYRPFVLDHRHMYLMDMMCNQLVPVLMNNFQRDINNTVVSQLNYRMSQNHITGIFADHEHFDTSQYHIVNTHFVHLLIDMFLLNIEDNQLYHFDSMQFQHYNHHILLLHLIIDVFQLDIRYMMRTLIMIVIVPANIYNNLITQFHLKMSLDMLNIQLFPTY